MFLDRLCLCEGHGGAAMEFGPGPGEYSGTLTLIKINENSGFPDGSVVKNQPAKQEMQVISLGQDSTLEEEMATCSSNSFLKNPMDRGASRAIVHVIAKSQTPLHSATEHAVKIQHF